MNAAAIRSACAALCLAAAVGCAETPRASSVDAASQADADASKPATVNVHLQPRFLNIAHRGGSKLAPEETLVAYQNAISLKADVIECDVHATSDGVLVCMHDNTVDRTTDGKGAIKGMTFEALRALDAGYRFSSDGGKTFAFRGKGVQVASLEEFLSAYPAGAYAIEIKQYSPSIAAQVAQAVAKHGAVQQTVIASFADQTLAEVRQADPTILTALATGEMLDFTLLTEEMEATYVPPGLVIQAPHEEVTPASIARAHRLGMKVQAWTVNDQAEMERLIQDGVDGIFTDDPALLATVIAAH